MFYKIFAAFMLFSTVAYGQAVTPCNAFGENSAECGKVPMVENFELVDEVLEYNVQQRNVQSRVVEINDVVEVRQNEEDAVASRTLFPSLNQGCGSVFSRGEGCGPIFKRNEGCEKCVEEEIIIVEEEEPVYVRNYEPVADLDYDAIHRQCTDFAPINFSYVDFRLQNQNKNKNKFSNYINKLGDYRFRIFGCRRNEKEMFLNVGRTMQKDMNFFDIFDKVYGNCIPQTKMPKDLCNPCSAEPMPEYLLTAEIVDYAMNVCDEFDWKKVSNKERRNGTSEMTVVWRLTDVAREKVFWKGTSTGYAELQEGDINGEVVLVEEAFEDALIKLRYLEGFEKQISTRHTIEDNVRYRNALAKLESEINPAKCEYQAGTASCMVNYNQQGCACNCQQSMCCGGVDSNGVRVPAKVPCGTTCSAGKACGASCSASGACGMCNSCGGCGTCNAAGACGVYNTIINENGEVVTISGGGSCNVMLEDGGTMVATSGACGSCNAVVEDGGLSTASSSNACNSKDGCGPIFERNKPCDGSSCGPIFKRNEGCDSLACRLFEEDEEVIEIKVEEVGGSVAENSGSLVEVSEINEASGVDIFGNVDTVRVVEQEWIDIPVSQEQQQIVEAMFVESKGEFCIENELVNKDMNPFNVYKTRASMVEISSLSGKKKGVGLIINDQFILTSADMISKAENTFNVKTINGVEFKANGYRFSPNKNVALLLTQEPVKYTPVPLNLELPPVGKSGFMTLGMDLHKDGGEGYVDNTTTIAGYRFSEDKGAEIITNQHTQNLTVGGALVDDKGNIYGIAHYGKRYNDEPDMYMPIEEALKSLNVELCGRDFLNQKPWAKSTVETKRYKAPEEMKEVERK